MSEDRANAQATADVPIDVTVFEAERPRLVGIAYRMLGDVAEAEDVVQDAYLRWLNRPETTVQTPAAFLTTVVTRLAIDVLRSAKTRRETYVGPWLAEPVLFEVAAAEQGPEDVVGIAESVTIGFLRLLDALTPDERAAFLLHEVFEYSHAEIAAVLDKSDAASRKTLSRARAKLAERRDEPRRRARGERELELVMAFGAALAAADIDQVRAVLTADVVATSDGGGIRHAAVRPVLGAHRASRYFANLAKRSTENSRVDIAWVNGEPAFLLFEGDELDLVLIIGATEEGIDHLHTIRNPDKLGPIAEGYQLAF